MKKQKGITLTALVITIIVMLILVVVTVNFVLGDEGILTNAKTASEETEKKAILEELISMAVFNNEDGTINVTATAAKASDKYRDKFASQEIEGGGYLVTITGKSGTYDYKVTETKISIWDESSNPPEPEESTITFSRTGDLAIGSLVTAQNGEEFYVIGFSDDNTKVNMLAKYNLTADGSSQDTTGAINECEFSSTNYWESETSYPLDLNTYPIGDATSIITVAKDYGTSIGATGRLMTIEEVLEFGGSLDEYGGYNISEIPEETAFINENAYWLGSAQDSGWVYLVDGCCNVCYTTYDNVWDFFVGVRPVIEIPISSINQTT